MVGACDNDTNEQVGENDNNKEKLRKEEVLQEGSGWKRVICY